MKILDAFSRRSPQQEKGLPFDVPVHVVARFYIVFIKGWNILWATLLVAVVSGTLGVSWANDPYADGDISSATTSVETANADYYAADLAPSRRAVGALRQVQEVAAEMLAPERARVWGRGGRLSPQDLTNTFAVFLPDGGVVGFNVLDAEGFVDRYKCNLFVFELAYRAGLRIPMAGRLRGWGYPGPDEVLRQIARGSFDESWAVPASHLDYDELQHATGLGIPFILVAEGREGRAGHMGFIDVVHHIEHDGIDRVLRIEYSGWEANGDGAHYRRRTWAIQRFASIHLLELRQPQGEQAQCFAAGAPAAPSDLDATRYVRQMGSSTPPNVAASP